MAPISPDFVLSTVARYTTGWLIKLAFAIVFTLSFLVLTTSAPEVYAQDAVCHVVRRGESLSSIARAYGVTISIISQNNSIRNINILHVGQTLCFPGTAQSPAPVSTPPSIALPIITQPPAQQAVPSASSVQPEPMPLPAVSTPSAVAPPVEWPVAMATPQPTAVRYYTVRPGDTLYSICARYNVSVSAVRLYNRLNVDLIYSGQSLAIP